MTQIRYTYLLVCAYFFTAVATNSQHILDMVQKNNIAIVRCLFTDLLAHPKEVTISADHLSHALKDGLYFDGSSIPGYSTIHDSDMHLTLDCTSFRTIKIEQETIGIIFCTIDPASNSCSDNICARTALKTALQKAADMGYGVSVGVEIEFFLLDPNHNPCDSYAYFDVEPCSWRSTCNRQLINHLQGYGICVEKFHHEVAPGQYEISIHHANPLEIADCIVLAKHAIQEWAIRNNMQVSFMPKPLSTANGSGMHIHFSLHDITTKKNIFYSATDQYLLSKTAYHFIAGILNYIYELDIIFNPTVNSFERLVPGYEAPIYICWAPKNRSALIRIPEFNAHTPHAARAELRNPDASCNPYLAFTALLHMGLDGIEHQTPIAEAMSRNLYKLTLEEISHNNIQTLPSSLSHALELFQSSKQASTIFGQHICTEFSKAKLHEINCFYETAAHRE